MKYTAILAGLSVALISSAAFATEPTLRGEGHAGEGHPGGGAPAGAGMVDSSHHEFGQEGVIALEAETRLNVSSTSLKPPEGDSGPSTTDIYIAPVFHYFVMENLSVGALIDFDYSKTGDAKETKIGLGPQIGYNIPVADNLSFWPRVGVVYHISSKDEGKGDGSKSGHTLEAVVDAPLLIHLVPHFHFGIGPYMRMDLSSKYDGNDADKATTFGLAGTIGGWW